MMQDEGDELAQARIQTYMVSCAGCHSSPDAYALEAAEHFGRSASCSVCS